MERVESIVLNVVSTALTFVISLLILSVAFGKMNLMRRIKIRTEIVTEIRISYSVLARIIINDKYLLIYDKGVYKPPGGALQIPVREQQKCTKMETKPCSMIGRKGSERMNDMRRFVNAKLYIKHYKRIKNKYFADNTYMISELIRELNEEINLGKYVIEEKDFSYKFYKEQKVSKRSEYYGEEFLVHNIYNIKFTKGVEKIILKK